MCLIAYQPPGDAAFTPEVLGNGWQKNKDGAGYMFSVEGKLIIRKPFYKLKELKAAYAADHAEHGATSAFVVHFRWATHGDDGAGNIHPHVLADGNAALVHNGILYEFNWGGKQSDTAVFCATVLACRTPEQLVSSEFGQVLADMIGTGNKLVLMDNVGNVSIVRADEGLWDGGRWYSNGGYLALVFTPKAHYQYWGKDGKDTSVTRGIVFDSTADALTAWRKRFDEPKYAPLPVDMSKSYEQASLFDDSDLDDEGREWETPQSVEAEIAELELEQEEALEVGDSQYAESLAWDITYLRRSLEHNADMDLAMMRDGH